MSDASITSQIYLSRDDIRSQITDYVKSYLELENVDLTKSSFLSFIIDTFSTLTTNVLFYSASTYKEFFLTKAQLPETIFNLSAFLGYNTTEASYATAYVLLTVPLEFGSGSTFTLREGFKFTADSVEFLTYYSTEITVTAAGAVTVTVTEGNKVYSLPVRTTSSNFYVVLPVRQYKIDEQQFQIDEDLRTYEFTSIDVTLDGQVSEMAVQITAPGSSVPQVYTEFTSLYLMSSTDKGFVSRRTDEGRRLYFGNGLIGVQPEAGSTVDVTTKVTDGADGNVIAGSIKTGEKIYATVDGVTKQVSYSVTNTSAVTGGVDEESIEEIRSNAISNLTALGRLVSEDDFTHTNVVIEDSPLAANSIAVLKRSDVRVNEVQLYTTLNFNSEVVPTRNVYKPYSAGTTYVPRGTTITDDGVQYYTLLDMEIDSTLNKVAYYKYITYTIESTPYLEQSFAAATTYDIIATSFTAYSSGSDAVFELTYQSSETDADQCTCELEIEETSETFSMTNDATGIIFTYTFSPYTLLANGPLTYHFTIYNPSSAAVGEYTVSFTFRQDLSSFMQSNVASDSTNFIVYDIPVIKKSYYDDLVTAGTETDFEQQVMQSLMSTVDFTGYRMLTDFVNLKFSNTTGTMEGMLRNKTTKLSVLDIKQTSVPTSPSVGDRYIVNGLEGGSWEGHTGEIAQCTDATAGTWAFYDTVTDDIVYVSNQSSIYINTETGWFKPIYTNPLEIEVDVFKTEDYTGSDSDLATTVKTTLLSTFSSRFGSNVTIYRSEITDTLMGIVGVEHCRVVKPESSIYFDFDIDTFTEDELLEYSPDYIFFTEDEITVRVLS